LVSGPLHAYDLGAGTGRHTLLMAGRLGADSRVTAVDLLPEALERLCENAATAGLADRVETVAADL
jgi:predicted O-methyltransferase YrrM